MSTIQHVSGRERKAAKALQAMCAGFEELSYLDAVASVRDPERLADLSKRMVANQDAAWLSRLLDHPAERVVDETLRPGPATALAVCSYLRLTFPHLHPSAGVGPEVTDVQMHDSVVVYVQADQVDWSTAVVDELDGKRTVDTGLPAGCQYPAAVAERLAELAQQCLARRSLVTRGELDLDWAAVPLHHLASAAGRRLGALPLDAVAASLVHGPDPDRDPAAPWSAAFEGCSEFHRDLVALWQNVGQDPERFCDEVVAAAVPGLGDEDDLVQWLMRSQEFSPVEVADVLLDPASHLAVYAEHIRRRHAGFAGIGVPDYRPTLREDDARLREVGRKAWADWAARA